MHCTSASAEPKDDDQPVCYRVFDPAQCWIPEMDEQVVETVPQSAGAAGQTTVNMTPVIPWAPLNIR